MLQGLDGRLRLSEPLRGLGNRKSFEEPKFDDCALFGSEMTEQLLHEELLVDQLCDIRFAWIDKVDS